MRLAASVEKGGDQADDEKGSHDRLDVGCGGLAFEWRWVEHAQHDRPVGRLLLHDAVGHCVDPSCAATGELLVPRM